MGYTEKSNLRKSLDPKIFLRKGEGVSIKAEKTLFRIKKDTDTDISNKYGRYDKLPKLMKNRKDAHDKTQSNITGFNEAKLYANVNVVNGMEANNTSIKLMDDQNRTLYE